MATWTDIPDEVLEPGKPIRSVDALALRDNAIAIAGGAPGAPRVQTGGLANNAVTNEKIANMDAGKLNSGTVPGARMPTTHGAVGTYAFVVPSTQGPSSYSWGDTVSGSNLRPARILVNSSSGDADIPLESGSLSGTWRIMGARADKGNQSVYPRAATLAVRIS